MTERKKVDIPAAAAATPVANHILCGSDPAVGRGGGIEEKAITRPAAATATAVTDVDEEVPRRESSMAIMYETKKPWMHHCCRFEL